MQERGSAKHRNEIMIIRTTKENSILSNFTSKSAEKSRINICNHVVKRLQSITLQCNSLGTLLDGLLMGRREEGGDSLGVNNQSSRWNSMSLVSDNPNRSNNNESDAKNAFRKFLLVYSRQWKSSQSLYFSGF